MKMKYLMFVGTIILFLACTNETNQGGKTEQSDSLEQKNAELAEPPVFESYKIPNIAFVKGDKLFFYYPEDAEIKEFTDETDSVFQCDFDKDKDILYYTVVREGILWLRKVEFSVDDSITIADIGSLKIKKDDCISETYGERSYMKFVNGKVYVFHDFSWEAYSFGEVVEISCSGVGGVKPVDDYVDILSSYDYELEEEFQTKDNNLIYIGGSNAVNMSNNLHLEHESGEDIFFTNFEFSPDKSKLMFGAELDFGDLPHGPFCLVDIDGSNQKELMKDGISSEFKPLWHNNQLVFFRGEETSEGDYIEKLCITNSETNDFITIDENVDYFSAK